MKPYFKYSRLNEDLQTAKKYFFNYCRGNTIVTEGKTREAQWVLVDLNNEVVAKTKDNPNSAYIYIIQGVGFSKSKHTLLFTEDFVEVLPKENLGLVTIEKEILGEEDNLVEEVDEDEAETTLIEYEKFIKAKNNQEYEQFIKAHHNQN